jgi:hypothetical protein
MGREKHFWAVHLIFFHHLYDGLICVCLQTSCVAYAMRAVSLDLDLICLVLVGAFSGCDVFYVRSAFHALEIRTRPTEGDSLLGSSPLMHHHHSSGRKDYSTHTERRSANISIRYQNITLVVRPRPAYLLLALGFVEVVLLYAGLHLSAAYALSYKFGVSHFV